MGADVFLNLKLRLSISTYLLTLFSKKLRIRFDRNELSGAFGDIGTDLPLIVGIVLVSGLDPANVFLMFGIMQALTGVIYGMPMPVQPLKAVAVIAISLKLSGSVILGAGLSIGLVMLLLTLTGLINWIYNVVPNSVIRGIQFGLGTSLILLAFDTYIPADGLKGYLLSAVGFIIIISLIGNRRFPPALPVIILGALYAFSFNIQPKAVIHNFDFALPSVNLPNFQDILTGFIILAIPQIPLSITNSILATQKVAEDFFPRSKLNVKRIGFTYSFMNLLNPFLGGVPVCHGSGGLVGHYTFGARTGGSLIIYGGLYLIIGLFFSQGFDKALQIFPLPALGIILVFEGFGLAKLIRQTLTRKDLYIALVVGLLAIGLKYGFLIGLIVGTILHYSVEKLENVFDIEKKRGA